MLRRNILIKGKAHAISMCLSDYSDVFIYFFIKALSRAFRSREYQVKDFFFSRERK